MFNLLFTFYIKIYLYILGNCMKTSQGNVTLEKCEHFYCGCPEKNIWKHEFYKCKKYQCIYFDIINFKMGFIYDIKSKR